jgi:hypothetical protein
MARAQRRALGLALAAAVAVALHAALLAGSALGNLRQAQTGAASAVSVFPVVWQTRPLRSASAGLPPAAGPQRPNPSPAALGADRAGIANAQGAPQAEARRSVAPPAPAPLAGVPGDTAWAPPLSNTGIAPASALDAAPTAGDGDSSPPPPAAVAAAANAVAGAATAASDESSEAGASDAPAPPVYSTLPAPAATLHFELQRGLGRGSAVLRWLPTRAAYELSLSAQAFGIEAAQWRSTGSFDDAGLAPVRYSESRRGREVRATNFQRDSQRLSFSAQSQVWPLAQGMQDRTSWMLQLGAVLQANPALSQTGAQVTLAVVGTRGRPEPWVFSVVGRSGLNAPAGAILDVVHLVREPRRPYDTRVEVWLDPAQHHLPVQLSMVVQATGEGNHFRLSRLVWD